MLRHALSLTAALAAAPALAADITVEEFPGLTRIVVPARSAWTVSQTPRGLDLVTRDTGFPLSSPALRSGSRLSALDVWSGGTNSGIDIRFGCDCTASHYENGGAVVIDIAARIAPTAASRSAGWGRATIRQPTPEPASTTVRENTRTGDRDEAWRLANVLVGTPIPRRRPERPTRPTSTVPALPESTDPALDALRDSVMESMAFAVEQGRVTLERNAERSRALPVPAGCPDEAGLDLKRLVPQGSFRTASTGLRAAVYDDLKQIDPAAVRRLARYFIAFGLGEEARNVIKAFETTGKAETQIMTMANVLAGRTGDLEGTLLLKPGCGPRAAVWRAAVDASAKTGTVNKTYNETGGGLYDLPDPLRKVLGGRIALGLITEGERDVALRLWRDLETADGPDTPEMALLAAYARNAEPLDDLISLAASRSPIAGEAAIRAATLLTGRDDHARAERLGYLLEDLVFLYGDTPIGADLNLAFAQLQGRYGDLASALKILNAKALAQPERAGHWRDVAHETIRTASDGADPIERPADFEIVLSALQYLDDSPASDTAKIALTRKLMDAGGAHLAGNILKPALIKRSIEAKRLLAEAKLRDGDAAGARALLKGLRDKQSADEMAGLKARNATAALFGPDPAAPEAASITAARRLMEDTETDLSIVKELLVDG